MHCFTILFLLYGAVAVFSQDCPPEACLPSETCCPTDNVGNYSCCPFENAICCADLIHCCPRGTECDNIGQTCRPKVRQQSKLLNLDDLDRRQGESISFSDVCEPDSCSSGETCCPAETPGDYTCCPYGNAVCCEGHAFCCPEGTQCDIAGRRCTYNEELDENKLEKRQGLLNEENSEMQQCGDGNMCPFDSTCCMIADDNYGCCPHIHATCCPDMIHCCPEGEKCDVTSQYCVGIQTVHQSSVKGRALPIHPEESA